MTTGAVERVAAPADAAIIVGAGIAGLYAALKLAPRPVLLLTAAELGDGGSSTWAQGGLAAAVGADDSPDIHFLDTLSAGAGLVDEAAARVLVDEAPAAVEDLLRLGVPFDQQSDGRLKTGREAAHSRERVVHATGDRAGAAIMAALIDRAREAAHITIRERIVVEDVLIDDEGRAAGVLAVDIARGARITITSPEIVLATGGLGGLYAVTTNPRRAQGHGLAAAARAGAEIMDAEFVQFHPTALDLDIDPAPLATEALRGAGAILVDADGQRFMKPVHPQAELAPRDVVARAVEAQLATGRGAFLDARTAVGAAFPSAFPTVFEAAMKAGLDPRTALLPVAPAAHYHMGGVRTDLVGRTSVDGLYAIGEVACTGAHGANRLASNSLAESLVWGRRAANSVRECADSKRGDGRIPADRLALAPKPAEAAHMRLLRTEMSAECALIRSGDGLKRAIAAVGCLKASDSLTSGYFSALVAADFVLRFALAREESRGGHYRTDFPETRDGDWRHHQIRTLSELTA